VSRLSAYITKEVMEFVEKAKEEFENNPELETYRGDGYIALRYGLNRDCILVYELGNEVGLFAQWIER
jgi:hypothetical protein